MGSANRTFRNCGAVTKRPAIVCTRAGSDQDSSAYDLPGGHDVMYGRGGQAEWCNRRTVCALVAAALAAGTPAAPQHTHPRTNFKHAFLDEWGKGANVERCVCVEISREEIFLCQSHHFRDVVRTHPAGFITRESRLGKFAPRCVLSCALHGDHSRTPATIGAAAQI